MEQGQARSPKTANREDCSSSCDGDIHAGEDGVQPVEVGSAIFVFVEPSRGCSDECGLWRSSRSAYSCRLGASINRFCVGDFRLVWAVARCLGRPPPHANHERMHERRAPSGRLDFAHLTWLKHFAVLAPFRAFAPKPGKFRLLPTHARNVR